MFLEPTITSVFSGYIMIWLGVKNVFGELNFHP